MELDNYQYQEFEGQFGKTYLLNPDSDVVEVLNLYDKRHATVLQWSERNGGPFEYRAPIKGLSAFNPETGYYTVFFRPNLPMPFFLDRHPRQQVSRGLSKRNISLYNPHISIKDSSFKLNLVDKFVGLETLRWFTKQPTLRPLEILQTVLSVKMKDIEPHVKEAIRADKLSIGAALTRDIAAVNSKLGYILLLYRRIPIAYWVNGEVVMKETAQSYREQLEELNIGVINEAV